MTLDEIKERCLSKFGDKITILEEYIKEDGIQYVKYQCNICGYISETKRIYLTAPSKKRCCPICGMNKLKVSFEKALYKINKTHQGNVILLDIYVKNHETWCKCQCKECGFIWDARLSNLTHKTTPSGCPECSRNKHRYDFDKCAELIKQRHGDDVELIEVYTKNKKTWCKCKCKICGNIWETRLTCIKFCGCPICKASHLEKEIQLFLIENNINFEHNATNSELKWLDRQSLDYFLPEYNAAIECQGIQHFEETNYFKYTLDQIIQLDQNKRKLCEEHGIKLFYYSNLGIEYPYKVYEDKDELLHKIKGTEQ